MSGNLRQTLHVSDNTVLCRVLSVLCCAMLCMMYCGCVECMSHAASCLLLGLEGHKTTV